MEKTLEINKRYINISWNIILDRNEARKCKLQRFYTVLESYVYEDKEHHYLVYDVFGHRITNKREEEKIVNLFKEYINAHRQIS